MNDFTKEELEHIKSNFLYVEKDFGNLEPDGPLLRKIQSMIDAYCEREVKVIGAGQLLFHAKESTSAVIAEIHKQLDLCENDDESKCFRIDWKIIYGKKFGH